MSEPNRIEYGHGYNILTSNWFDCGTLNIPETIDCIGEKAFQNLPEIEIVILPHTLIAIEDCAFSCCPNLYKVNLPSSLVQLGEHAFCSTGIRNITIPGSLDEIPYAAFGSCTALKTALVKKGVKRICNNAFSDCNALQIVTIEDLETVLDPNAFMQTHSKLQGSAALTICAPPDSYAESFAKEYGFQFQPISLTAANQVTNSKEHSNDC